MIVNQTLNDILNQYFRNGTPLANVYMGLVDLASFTAFAAGDTMASHSGWTEFTDYSQSTRPAWAPPATTSEELQNSSPTVFTTTAAGSVYGIFLTTNSTKGGTTGNLVGAVPLDAVQVVPIGENLSIYSAVLAQSG